MVVGEISMKRDVYVIGAYQTEFKKWPEKTYKDLTREAYLGVLNDIGWKNGDEIQSGWFGNVFMGALWGQASIRGQVCMNPLVKEKLFPERVPIINVEGACGSGGMAFSGAWKDILSGQAEVSFAIGVEKLFNPDKTSEDMFRAFQKCMDYFNPEEWIKIYEDAARKVGKEFKMGKDRTVFMDTYAAQAAYHMNKYGTTQRQIAAAASKSHHNGTLNPSAQYRFEVSIEQVLQDREVNFPVTRSMCAPMGDGAAAAILCSGDYLKNLPSVVQNRAVKIMGIGMAGGKHRDLDEPGVTKFAGERAYKMAGVGPADIDFAEVHDAVAFSDIYEAEMLGFCPEGAGGKLAESGETSLEGRIPLNTSGGLVSKGHPLGATGLSMAYELVTQLRGEAGLRQVKNALIGLFDNGGGSMGLDDAVCIVAILQKDR